MGLKPGSKGVVTPGIRIRPEDKFNRENTRTMLNLSNRMFRFYEQFECDTESGDRKRRNAKDPQPKDPQPKDPQPKDPQPKDPQPKDPQPKDPQPKDPEATGCDAILEVNL